MEVVRMRGRDIPAMMRRGAVDVAILGRDLVEELGAGLWRGESLGFGQCRLMLAVPDGVRWDPARRWRVATRYPSLSRRWFSGRGVAVDLVTLAGAVEAAPRLGVADAIIDVVETGATLSANGLQPVEVVLESHATLVARPDIRAQAVELLSGLSGKEGPDGGMADAQRERLA
jgi:ATP phosphoribosyltransferase